MNKQLTASEIEQTLKVARIIALNLTPEQFQALADSQEHLKEEGFVDGVYAASRLLKEKGTTYSGLVKSLEQLFQQREHLESEVEKLSAKKDGLESVISGLEGTIRQLNEVVQQVRQELAAIRSQRDRETRELETFRREAAEEKGSLQKEVETCREQADVSQSEIQTARELKAELEKGGYGLDLALSLCREFGKTEKPREKLISGIGKHGSLQKYLEALTEWGESQKKAYQSRIQSLQNDCLRLAGDLSRQEAAYNQRELQLRQQHQNLNENAEILDFYRKYKPLQGIIDYLGKFGVGFFSCDWCGARYWVLEGGKTDRNRNCLWCNMPNSAWDSEAYKALGWEPGWYLLIPRGGK